MRQTLREERAPDGEVAIAFVGDRAMRRINREYRGVDRTTDVLSFSYLDEAHTGGVLGEIYVSPGVARTQARQAGEEVPEEIARLTIHGLLHVLGYDHDTARGRRAMFGRQERYLDRHYRAGEPC